MKGKKPAHPNPHEPDFADVDIPTWLRALPKVELHLHLEGSTEPETLVALSQRHDAHPLTLVDACALYTYKDFLGFLDSYKAMSARLQTPDDYELITYNMVRSLAAQGVVHAEVFVAVGVIYLWRNHDPAAFEPIFEGLERARKRGESELGLSLYWIFDAVRHFTVPEAQRVFRKGAQMRGQYPSIIGIGLGGDERSAGSEPFRALYAEAREAGLRLTNHAGETTGPEAIWEALSIGSERIGHALSAIRDPALMEELKARQIGMELNPTSNVKTGICASFAHHPLRRYFDEGLLVSLNSDDPAFFGSNVANEYRLAAEVQGFNRKDLRKLASYSIRSSFLPEMAKSVWLARIENIE